MSSPAPVLSERIDIHRSCKSLETVVNVLNDYCEAASAIVTLQKKLSKALREAAATKCISEIAVNALTASATIFETLSDVDSKFAKAADKECDFLSADVKKWFKKLAKEEKAHDERINGANTRIKQAGQNYEKKAKKNPREAAEEHGRYINLLSALGPEMAQEKYHHSLFVSQRHTVTTYNVASCLTRVADAEWLRFCEGVRRSAPYIGKLGEWKALCEGGWTGPVPGDLPGMDVPPAMASPTTTLPTVDEEKAADSTADTHRKRPQTDSPTLKAPVQFPPADDASDHSRGSEDNRKTSMASLDHFPSPPTHFPIPPLDAASPTTPEDPSRPLMLPRKPSIRRVISTESNAPAPPPTISETREPKPLIESPKPVPQQLPSPEVEEEPPAPTRGIDVEEFGVQRSRPSPARSETLEKSPPTSRVERSGSTGSGSVVAAMRTRYAQSPTPQSPPREAPRLPVSVPSIASRYQSIASPPPDERRHSSNSTSTPPGQGSSASSSRYSTSAIPASNQDDIAQRRKRIEELEELEMREREHELRMKEREVEYKARELDRERARIAARGSQAPPDAQRHRQGQTYGGRYSYSATHLVPPDSPQISQSGRVSPGGAGPGASPVERTSYGPPLVRPRVESKPKGWIRRLSMPVISSLDSSSKKPNAGISSAQWNASRPSLESDGRSYRG